MFDRFKNRSEETNGTSGRTAVAERERSDEVGATRTRDEAAAREDTAATRGEPATRRHAPVGRAATADGAPVATREHMRAVRARQRDEIGRASCRERVYSGV